MSDAPKFIISIINPGESPADNGRTVHALKLAKELKEGGAEVRLVFTGQGVNWISRLSSRDEKSHPFDTRYGPVYDEVRSLAHACNMCCKRFNAVEAASAAQMKVEGDGSEHVNLGALLLEGWQLVHH